MIELPDPFLDYDAAYVMGALDPYDRRAFELHLSQCARCTTAVSELAGMPGLLAQVPAHQVLTPSTTALPVPDTLLPRMVAELRRERRRRRALLSIVGLAAAAVLIVVTVLTTGALAPIHPATSGTSSPGTALVMRSAKLVPVTASVRLNHVAWGTRLSLTCTYWDNDGTASDTPQAWTFRLVVVPRDGGMVQQVAQWTAIAGATETPTGSTDLAPDQIQDIRLLNSRGETLLHVSPPPPA